MAVRFVQAHQAAVLAVVVVMAAAGTAGGGYWWYQQRQEEAASRVLARALMAMRGQPPGSAGNPEEASKRLQEVVQQYPQSRSAEEALIELGSLQYNAGKTDQALATYSQYLDAFPRGRFALIAALGKAYSQEAKGDFPGAAQTLSQALESAKTNALAGEAYMALARVYEEMKKTDDAMRVYGEVVEKYGQSHWAQHAMQRMTALKAK
jgi:TolA-binding protein